MKMVHSPQLILVLLLVLTTSVAQAVVGPVPEDLPEETTPPPPPKVVLTPKPKPAATKPAPVKAKPKPTPAKTAEEAPVPVVKPQPEAKSPPVVEHDVIDHIQGIGKYKFGAKLTNFPPSAMRIVDPNAKGKLLRVSPYGDNYLVTDLTGLSWGNIPLSGLIVTFHDGTLIDIQMAMSGKKVDFYLAERAFKEKYGPSETTTFPVATWSGAHTQVTMVMVGAIFSDPGSLDKPALGKVELLDQGRWSKVEAAQKAQLTKALDKEYQDSIKKVKANL